MQSMREDLVGLYGEGGSMDLLLALVFDMPIACLLKDEDLRFRAANAAFAGLHGVSVEEMLGGRANMFFDAEASAEMEARERRVIETGESLEIEQEFVSAAGEQHFFITLFKRIVAPSGARFVLITLTDATALNAARVQAKQADRMKSEFLANMSHEIRTPMNGILGMAEILRQSGLNERQHRHADIIADSGATLLTIINDVLDFSKIEAGQLDLVEEVFDPVDLTDSVATLMRDLAQKNGLNLRLVVSGAPPTRVRGDPRRIRQVLSNFLSNAIKFTLKGQVTLSLAAAPARHGARLRFEVRDTGMGLSKDDQAKVFQRFVQVRNPVTHTSGTGLGLPICASLVELMGGRIGVESELDVGSCFWFEITAPVVPAENRLRA